MKEARNNPGLNGKLEADMFVKMINDGQYLSAAGAA